MVRPDQFSRNFGPPDQNFRRTKISVTVLVPRVLGCGLVPRLAMSVAPELEPMEVEGSGRKPRSKPQQSGERKERVSRKDGHHRSGRHRRRDHSSPLESADSAGSRSRSTSEPQQRLRERTHHRKRWRRRSSSPSADSDLSSLSDLSDCSSPSDGSPTRRRIKTHLKRLKKDKKELKRKAKRTKKVMKHHKKRKKLMRKMKKYGCGEEPDRGDAESGAELAGPSLEARSPDPSAPPLGTARPKNKAMEMYIFGDILEYCKYLPCTLEYNVYTCTSFYFTLSAFHCWWCGLY